MIWSCVKRAFFIVCLQWTDLTPNQGHFSGQGQRLTQAGAIERLFDRFDATLRNAGYRLQHAPLPLPRKVERERVVI